MRTAGTTNAFAALFGRGADAAEDDGAASAPAPAEEAAPAPPAPHPLANYPKTGVPLEWPDDATKVRVTLKRIPGSMHGCAAPLAEHAC